MGLLDVLQQALGSASSGRHSDEVGEARRLPRGGTTEISTGTGLAPRRMMDQMSQFYTKHPGLVKVLGSAAVAVAVAKMKNNLSKR